MKDRGVSKDVRFGTPSRSNPSGRTAAMRVARPASQPLSDIFISLLPPSLLQGTLRN